MYKSFSGIALRRDNRYLDWSDRYEDIIDYFGLPDDPEKLVCYEYVPREWRYDDPEAYELRVAQDILPDWWHDRKVEIESQMAGYVKRCIVSDKQEILGGGPWILADGAEIECAVNARIIGMYGSARISAIHDSARVDVMRDSACVRAIGDSASVGAMYDSACVRAIGDSAHVGAMYDSAYVGTMRDLAHIGTMYESARVNIMHDSARIGVMCESAYIGTMYDSARIESMYDSAHIAAIHDSAGIAHDHRKEK